MEGQGRPLTQAETRSLAYFGTLFINVSAFHIPLLILDYFVGAYLLGGNPVGYILPLGGYGILLISALLTIIVYNVVIKNGWGDVIKNTGRTTSSRAKAIWWGVTLLLWYSFVYLVIVAISNTGLFVSVLQSFSEGAAVFTK